MSYIIKFIGINLIKEFDTLNQARDVAINLWKVDELWEITNANDLEKCEIYYQDSLVETHQYYWTDNQQIRIVSYSV